MKMPFEQIRTAIEAMYGPERLTFRAASDSWVLDGRGVSDEDIANDVAYAIDAPIARILIVLKKLANEAQLKNETAAKEWVMGLETRSGDDTALRQWLTLMQPKNTEAQILEASVHAMKQWLWQVKRSVLHLDVVWQVMPIFWSTKGGSGKSHNISALIDPLKNYTKTMSVADLNEKFADKQLAQTYIAYFDEFHGIGNLAIALFKTILTGKPFDRRGMYTSRAVYAVNRLSCIASTNRAPPHGYEDETGMRRVWSIQASDESTRDENNPRRVALEALTKDPSAIWACVSVHDAAPETTIDAALSAYMLEIRENYLRTQSPLESFCKDNLKVAKPHSSHEPRFRINISVLKRACRQYCFDSGLKMPKGDNGAIAKALMKLGYDVVNHSGTHKLYDHILIQHDEMD